MTLNFPLSDAPAVTDRPRRMLEIIDSHTCGQPTRLVIAGSGIAPGTDPREARDELAAQRDWVRRLAVLEPRGHRSMFAVALIEPAAAGQPFGLVYMDANGYPDMCGHATIGAATTLFERGLLTPPDPQYSGATEFSLHVPMGMLDLTATFDRGRCTAVAFRTPLAYYLGSVDLLLDDGAHVTADIAYGGQWYAYVPVSVTGLTVAPANIDGLIGWAARLRPLIATQCALVDPLSGIVPKVGNIVWTADPEKTQAMAKNVPISSAGSFDRSPCGTATCARMAVLAAKGELGVGQAFINEGLVGTLYYGQLVSKTEQGAVQGYVPQVEGSAWLMGEGRIWADPNDPLGDGFLV